MNEAVKENLWDLDKHLVYRYTISVCVITG
jgi:hypothetical protein